MLGSASICRTLVVLLCWLSANALGAAVLPSQDEPSALTKQERIEAKRWDAVQVCFGCHQMTEEIINEQPRRRQKKHRRAMAEQRSCLDCHTSDDVACCHDRMFPKIDRWE